MTISDYEWLQVTTSDYKPDYEWLRVTTSDYEPMSDYESDSDWNIAIRSQKNITS